MFGYSNGSGTVSSQRSFDARAGWDSSRRAVVLLTPRQREILRLIAQGLSNKEVAERLRLSTRTVKNHLTSIYLALGVSGRIAAILVWERNRRSVPASVALT